MRMSGGNGGGDRAESPSGLRGAHRLLICNVLPRPLTFYRIKPVAVYSLLQIVFFVLALWAASRAEPLGGMPYRWGTWVGVVTVGQAVGAVISCITAVGASLVLIAALYTLALTAAVASFGILRRRRFGVVAFVCTHLLGALILPFVDAVPGHPYAVTMRKAPLTGLVLTIFLILVLIGAVFFVCTVIYFKRRWALMKT
jgi:hypothetical protein